MEQHLSATLAAAALVPALALGGLVDRLAAAWVEPRGVGPTRAAAVLVTAGLVSAYVGAFGLGSRSLVGVVILSVLVLLSVIDLERQVLPNRIVLPAAGLVLGAQLALVPGRAADWLLGALLAALVLLAAHLVYPPGMGMGDVKLGLLLGAGLGAAVAVALAVAIVAAALAAIAVLVRHGQAGRRTALPFGPFLAFGAVVALFAGDPLLDLYLRTL